jgi:hypothetical protein
LREAEYEVHAGLAEARRQALAALTGRQPAAAAPLALPPRLVETLTAGAPACPG